MENKWLLSANSMVTVSKSTKTGKRSISSLGNWIDCYYIFTSCMLFLNYWFLFCLSILFICNIVHSSDSFCLLH
jgi:hypothetical protein